MGLQDILEPLEAEAKVVYEDGSTNYADDDLDEDGSTDE